MIARLGLEEAEKRKRRAMSDGGRKGGEKSGKARRENRPWIPHATELRQVIYAQLPGPQTEMLRSKSRRDGS